MFLSETITHKGLTYKTVQSPYTERIWLDRNLGASQKCLTFDDVDCYGDYYQWGRGSDGHEKPNSSITSNRVTTLSSGTIGGKFVVDDNFIDNDDWTGSADGNGDVRSTYWSRIDGGSICPVGFRVPTIDEIKYETLDNGVNNKVDAFDSFLRLPTAAYRFQNDGAIFGENFGGWLSSSTPSGGDFKLFTFNTRASIGTQSRTSATSVRCIKDNKEITGSLSLSWSGKIVFKDSNGDIRPIPSNTIIRITPNEEQINDSWGGVEAVVNSNGNWSIDSVTNSTNVDILHYTSGNKYQFIVSNSSNHEMYQFYSCSDNYLYINRVNAEDPFVSTATVSDFTTTVNISSAGQCIDMN